MGLKASPNLTYLRVNNPRLNTHQQMLLRVWVWFNVSNKETHMFNILTITILLIKVISRSFVYLCVCEFPLLCLISSCDVSQKPPSEPLQTQWAVNVYAGFAYIVWIKCPHKDIKIKVTYIVHEENCLVNKQSLWKSRKVCGGWL